MHRGEGWDNLPCIKEQLRHTDVRVTETPCSCLLRARLSLSALTLSGHVRGIAGPRAWRTRATEPCSFPAPAGLGSFSLSVSNSPWPCQAVLSLPISVLRTQHRDSLLHGCDQRLACPARRCGCPALMPLLCHGLSGSCSLRWLLLWPFVLELDQKRACPARAESLPHVLFCSSSQLVFSCQLESCRQHPARCPAGTHLWVRCPEPGAWSDRICWTGSPEGSGLGTQVPCE